MHFFDVVGEGSPAAGAVWALLPFDLSVYPAPDALLVEEVAALWSPGDHLLSAILIGHTQLFETNAAEVLVLEAVFLVLAHLTIPRVFQLLHVEVDDLGILKVDHALAQSLSQVSVDSRLPLLVDHLLSDSHAPNDEGNEQNAEQNLDSNQEKEFL